MAVFRRRLAGNAGLLPSAPFMIACVVNSRLKQRWERERVAEQLGIQHKVCKFRFLPEKL